MTLESMESTTLVARSGALANIAVAAKDPTEESMAKVIVLGERKRLGIESDSDVTNVIDEE